MQNLNTTNQSKDKITAPLGYWISSLTLIDKALPSYNIQLTGLESMWYNHEENIDHPEGREYPTGVNTAHRNVMVKKVCDSVFARTGINPADYSSVIHASTSPGRNKDGSFRDDVVEGRYVLRNV